MKIAIVTFDGFNELDSFIASAILNRVKTPPLVALITAPGETVTSMNGVVVRAQAPLSFAQEADAVLIGSGRDTREMIERPGIMGALRLDPRRQLVGAQCSGALVLAKLGLLEGQPACTDSKTRPWAEAAGVKILDQAFHASGNLATAGGCLASHYLAAWVILRLAGRDAAESVIRYVAPVGEGATWVARMLAAIEPFLPRAANAA